MTALRTRDGFSPRSGVAHTSLASTRPVPTLLPNLDGTTEWLKIADGQSTSSALLTLQRQAGNGAVQQMLKGLGAPSVAQRIQEASTGGQPMDVGARRRIEAGLGTDLGPVRVHTDSRADELSRSIGATAFTSGTNMFFRSGTYDPGSNDGVRTLAHEATHVVQQATGPVAGVDSGDGVSISDPSDAFEQAADSDGSAHCRRLGVDGTLRREKRPTTTRPRHQAEPRYCNENAHAAADARRAPREPLPAMTGTTSRCNDSRAFRAGRPR